MTRQTTSDIDQRYLILVWFFKIGFPKFSFNRSVADNYADNIEKLDLDTMNSLLCSAISDSIPGIGAHRM